MRSLRLQNPAGVFGDLSAFVVDSPPLGTRAVVDDLGRTWIWTKGYPAGSLPSVMLPGPEERAVSARLVPAAFGHRCCAPGCGKKIKPLDAADTMYEVIWTDGTVRYLEEGCVFDFVHGHVDYGGGHGRIPGLPDVQPWRPFEEFSPSPVTITRATPVTISPTIEWKTAWAGDDPAPGPPAGHMRISVDGGPPKDIPFPAVRTAEGLNAYFASEGLGDIIHVLTDEERAEQQRLAEEAARPENVRARWLKQVEALTNEELETVLEGFGVFTRERKRAAKRYGVRRFLQVGLTPEEQQRAADYIHHDLYDPMQWEY